jgi:hypothetical protein
MTDAWQTFIQTYSAVKTPENHFVTSGDGDDDVSVLFDVGKTVGIVPNNVVGWDENRFTNWETEFEKYEFVEELTSGEHTELVCCHGHDGSTHYYKPKFIEMVADVFYTNELDVLMDSTTDDYAPLLYPGDDEYSALVAPYIPTESVRGVGEYRW